MAIRTISMFQGHYYALRSHWVWDELLDLSFVGILARSRCPDHSTSYPTIFTTPPHISTSTSIISHHHVPGTYLGAISCADVEYREFTDPGLAETVIFGGAEDDQELTSLDSSLSSTDFDLPSRIRSSRDVCGLGISGLLSKDGSEPFTGLGVISVSHFAWRYIPTSGNLESGFDDSEARLNTPHSVCRHNMFHKASDTNANTALAQARMLKFIVERDPGSSDAHDATETTPTQQPVTPINHCHSRRRTLSLPPPVKHFAAPTISSELKKIPHTCLSITHPNRPYRRRLSGFPLFSHGTSPSRFRGPRPRIGATLPTFHCSSDIPTKFADKAATS